MSKIGMRNAWFQVHKWIGLILAVLIIPLSLTGAALVWDEALDHALNPQRYATSGAGTVDPQLYIAAARGVIAPGERIMAMTLPAEAGDPVTVMASKPGVVTRGGPPARTMVWIDPPSARVLDHGNSGTGLIRVMHNIHGQFLIPGVGRQIVGWIGVAMAFSCFTGIWLWWPTVGRWARGLRWKRHRNTDTNLHHLLGFWIAVPLFVLSLTGMWISFPQVFGGAQGGMGGPPRGGARPAPLAQTRLTLDTVIASAQAKVPGDVAQVTWPTDQKPEWKLGFKGSQASVGVDDTTGATKPSKPERETLARTMRRIHDGTRMGLLWQIIIFLGGILPAVLAVTGIIMWWRARGWKAQLRARQRAMMQV